MKHKIHFTASYLLNPFNPVTINLIGAGGTGSQVFSALARMNCALKALGHPGLFVRLFDDDIITPSNCGRQLYCEAEIGLNKSVALTNRFNRFYGTNWKAIPHRYDRSSIYKYSDCDWSANIILSCVDTIRARFEIATILKRIIKQYYNEREKPYYWLDFGNAQYTGQVLVSTVGKIEQPKSKKFLPVPTLPPITDEFKDQLSEQARSENNQPSCSLAQALNDQDLFINPAVANAGVGLFWQMLREGMTINRGVFINLKEFRTVPMKIT